MSKAGNTEPVGDMRNMVPIPNKYAFTISRPGIFTIMANAPMIGIVSTAIPEDELTGIAKKKKKSMTIIIKIIAGKCCTTLDA